MVDNPEVRSLTQGGTTTDENGITLSVLHSRHEQESAHDYLWRLLHGGKLAGLHFRRNQVVDGYVAPFYCRLSGLVVELDEEEVQEPAPFKEREQAFARHGLQTLHIEAESLIDRPADALQHILRAAETPKSNRLSASHSDAHFRLQR